MEPNGIVPGISILVVGMRRSVEKSSEHYKRTVNKMKNGFTLLEVLLALLTFSIGIIGIAPLFISAPRYNQSSQAMTEATTLAQSKFEELKAFQYDAIAGGEDNIQGSTGVAFKRRWTTQIQGNSKIVSCVIAWQDWVGHRVDFFYAYPNL
jgi:prepilin-type N-terminal cleavage/methylation domain-containing protein